MLTKYLAAGLIGSALLVSPVFAEDTATTNKVGASTTAEAYHGDWRTSKVVGLSVYNSKDENIGSISDLLMDKSGNIKAAVIGVGGFLGMGEHLVAIPFDKIKFVEEPAKTASTTAPPPPSNAPTRPASTTTTGAATSSSATMKSNEWYPDHAMFDATKDELKQLPEFKYSS
ncbi:PRC-barrel domain-containing protein [Bradyrhizobium sp.]|jgi:sporulation protein YlmC with PRC-barrel domain|uniref:PRC-barrel domain-containing protein n=1 Tax=Bradyrhizobium sp. TaxID=376 RepID=UPI002C2134C4|nr:PRC-barrel domain-containing protein [Bradyrhizobium sp.]HWX59575.1 PRC-barrel domain-containing protein [Bradyrhizobium sp.]